MKQLNLLITTATTLEAEIADLVSQQEKLTADVERLTRAGDVSDKALDDLVRKRGKLDLLPAAIARREERFEELLKEIRSAVSAQREQLGAELKAREAAAAAEIDAALAPIVADEKARADLVKQGVEHVPAVRAAAALMFSADSAASFGGTLANARNFAEKVTEYFRTVAPLTPALAA